MRRPMGLSLALVLFVLPLAFNPWARDAFEDVKAIILCACAGGLAMMFALEPRRRFGPLLWPATAVVATFAASTAVSVDPAASWAGLVGLGGMLVLLALVVLGVIAAVAGRTPWVAVAVAASGVLAAMYGVLQRLGLDFMDWRVCDVFTTPEATLWAAPQCHRSFDAISTFGNQDFLGFYLAMALPFAVYLTRRNRLWLPQVAVMLAGLAASGSRAAWAGAAVGLAIVLWGYVPRWAMVAGVLAAVLGGLYLERAHERHDSLVARRMVWQDVTRLALQRPVLGWGPETLGEVYTRDVDETRWTHTHNRWLDTVFERGAAGLAADLWLFVAAALVAWRHRTNRRVRTLFAAVAAGTAAAMAGVTPLAAWALQWAALGLLSGEADGRA